MALSVESVWNKKRKAWARRAGSRERGAKSQGLGAASEKRIAENPKRNAERGIGHFALESKTGGKNRKQALFLTAIPAGRLGKENLSQKFFGICNSTTASPYNSPAFRRSVNLSEHAELGIVPT